MQTFQDTFLKRGRPLEIKLSLTRIRHFGLFSWAIPLTGINKQEISEDCRASSGLQTIESIIYYNNDLYPRRYLRLNTSMKLLSNEQLL